MLSLYTNKFLFIKLILIMKNVVKIVSILLLISGIVFVSCQDKNKDKDKQTSVSAPTNLSVTDITWLSAKLTWSGTADSYEIAVGNKTYTATTTLCAPTDLSASTPYTWKVRAKKGNNYSEWVDGPNFTTLQAIPEGVTLQFGTMTWTAAYAGIRERSNGFELAASRYADSLKYPSIYFFFKKSGLTTFPLAGNEPYFAEYLENSTFTIPEDPNQVPYGEWWDYEGSINVVLANASKVAGVAEIVMFNAYQYYIEEKTNPDVKVLKILFNVDIVAYAAMKNDMERKNFSTLKTFKR